MAATSDDASASSSSSSSNLATPAEAEKFLPHYVIVCKDAWRGVFKVEVGQTVRTFKDTVAAFMNTHGRHEAFNLSTTVTADSFQLRPGNAKDIILDDTDLIHSKVPYNFITPTIFVVMLDADGNAMPIEEPPVAPPRHYSVEFMNDLKKRIREEIDAKYAVIKQ